MKQMLPYLAAALMTGCQTPQSVSPSESAIQPTQEKMQGVKMGLHESPWAYPERAFTSLQLLDKILKYAEAGLPSRERFERDFGVILEMFPEPYIKDSFSYVSEAGNNWFFNVRVVPPADTPAPGHGGGGRVELPGSKSFCLNRYKAIDYIVSQGWEKRIDQSYENSGIDGTHWGKRLSNHDSSVYLVGGPCVARIEFTARVLTRKKIIGDIK